MALPPSSTLPADTTTLCALAPRVALTPTGWPGTVNASAASTAIPQEASVAAA
jgi:hypothetical protein